MFEFVTMPDLHFDKPRLQAILGIERAEQLKVIAMKQVYDYAKSKGIRHIVYLGDIADQPYLSDYAKQLFGSTVLDETEFEHHIILGNHDVEQKDVNSLTFLELFTKRNVMPNIHLYSGHHSVILDGVDVEFLSFPYKEPLKKHSLCFAHLERPGALRDNGMPNGGHGEPTPKGENFWIMGHLHTPQELERTIYPGTLFQTTFGELSDKRFCHFRVNQVGKKIDVKFKSIVADKPFTLKTVKAISIKDLAEISNSDNTYYRVFYKGFELPDDWLSEHENVVECKSYSDNATLTALLETENIEWSITDGLSDFLTANGFDKKQIKKAIKLVKSL